MNDGQLAAEINPVNSKRTYSDSLEHLGEELKRLDLLIQIQVIKELDRQPENLIDSFMGLVVSEKAIIELLEDARNPLERESPSPHDHPKIKQLYEVLDGLNSQISVRREASQKEGVFLALPYLAQLFSLTPFDEQCILICLAPELDRKYEKLYAYLQDDLTRRKPSVEWIVNLLCPLKQDRLAARLAFDSQAPLLKYEILQMLDSEPDGQSSLLSNSVKLDNRIVNFLLGFNQIDSRLESIARLVSSQTQLEEVMLAREYQNRIRNLVQSCLNDPRLFRETLIFYLHGPVGSGKQALVEAVCQELKFPLIVADVAKMLQNEQSFQKIMVLLGRETILQPAALCLTNFDSILTEDEKNKNQLQRLLEGIQQFSRLTFILGSQAWKPMELLRKHFFIDMAFSIPDDGVRKNVWDSLRKHYRFADEIDFGAVAGKFRFSPGKIKDALIIAQHLARWRFPEDGRITKDDLHSACRSQAEQKLSTLGNKIKSTYTFDDIVLPSDQLNQLREIINQVKYRKLVYSDWGFHHKLSRGTGLNVLFSGPPGTGKTMAAEVIANELSLDLYKIDLSQVVSKYIGETEKSLQRIFDEAAASHTILFFDEADALFGKRSEGNDANDRYANTETAYLLQKIEEFEGIAILATNLSRNIDEAYLRRLHYHVSFPFPDERQRLRIWQRMFPDQAPKSEIDLAFLANRFALSAGHLKNVVLTAAFLAADDAGVIEMKHIVRALKYELQKIGKLCLQADFGKYYEYIR